MIACLLYGINSRSGAMFRHTPVLSVANNPRSQFTPQRRPKHCEVTMGLNPSRVRRVHLVQTLSRFVSLSPRRRWTQTRFRCRSLAHVSLSLLGSSISVGFCGTNCPGPCTRHDKRAPVPQSAPSMFRRLASLHSSKQVVSPDIRGIFMMS